jgi:DNA-binding beta-propeller fold protein YncE
VPNTLVRIDPETNAISDVIHVRSAPFAVAVSGRDVWVYNRGDSSISEIDATRKDVRQTTRIRAGPVDLGFLAGPVLTADADGAWIAGVDDRGKPLLTRVLSHARGRREYPLDHQPRAIAAGLGAVWVLGRGAHDNQVLRVDPTTGAVNARTRFPASSRLSSLAVGLGAVWVVSSTNATLYRIDPHSAAVTGHTDLGQRAGRPNVQFGRVWVGVSDAGGMTLLVDPRTLSVAVPLDCCALGDGYDAVNGFGSTWTTDWQTGTVVRWDGATYEIVESIRVTDPPFFGGDCMTSIAAGAGAAWVTVAPTSADACQSS